MGNRVCWFEQLNMGDIERVGGKNASLGEMTSAMSTLGIKVPSGFATTADCFREFLQHNGLQDRIMTILQDLDVTDVVALRASGAQIRQQIVQTPLPEALLADVSSAYAEMGDNTAVAVRSSATAEDLPQASFAGQQESFLNVCGMAQLQSALHQVFASLYEDRAIAYRIHQGFAHQDVALSVGVQRMARSDIGASGVVFTLDTESGFDEVILVTASWGLGEAVVQGAVNPDEFYLRKRSLVEGLPAIVSRKLGAKAVKMIYADGDAAGDTVRTVAVQEEQAKRFCLSDAQLEELGRQALAIEGHYKRPMDIEWALDGNDQQIYILQARPETVQSQQGPVSERFVLQGTGAELCRGRAIGSRIGCGMARVVDSISEQESLQPGDVLITDMTDPNWEPVMKRAAAIVTNRGGRTCHAAIIARELGVPAVVGCGDATTLLSDEKMLTVSCAEGDTGRIYRERLPFAVERNDNRELVDLPVKLMMNIGNPGRAFHFSRLPNAGVGLARLEFIISNTIGIHPRALLEFEQQPEGLQQMISDRIAGYASPVDFYVDKLVEGIAQLATAFYPKPVILRLSDFKSNEYANLLAGDRYEPAEENPMLGWRGTARYLSADFRSSFLLECRAVKRVREQMGLDNIEVMVPFVRSVDDAAAVVALLAENGLRRGDHGLRLIMMCELPTNALLAEQFLVHFDGFSIGSNDMTQLTLGLDRDSALVADLFDERDAAVKRLLEMAIRACRAQGKYVGICGQGPSDYPDFAQWLMEQGIDSISLNPDTLLQTWQYLSQAD